MSIAPEEQAAPRARGNEMKMRGFQFRLALPLGQLAPCALILWPMRGLIRFELGLPMRMGEPPWGLSYRRWTCIS
jgi:hypothetical protein